MFILLFLSLMKKIIWGLLFIVWLFYIGFSYWDYINKCTEPKTYKSSCNKTCSSWTLYEFKLSSGNEWYFKSCCDWKVYSGNGNEISNLLDPNLSNVHCCDEGEKYDSVLRKCVCENKPYWRGWKCCDWEVYNWKTITGDDWYYEDCGKWFIYDYTGGEVVKWVANSHLRWYDVCWIGSVVTNKWRCISCAWAANLSSSEIIQDSVSNCITECPANYVAYTAQNWVPWCCPWTVQDWVCHEELLQMWVRINNSCLIDWQCGLNVYRILWIRTADNYDPSVSNVASDFINAAVSFVWTVVTIAFIAAGVICSINSISWKDSKKALKVFTDSAIGMLFVWWAYVIVRLAQFLATAWS